MDFSEIIENLVFLLMMTLMAYNISIRSQIEEAFTSSTVSEHNETNNGTNFYRNDKCQYVNNETKNMKYILFWTPDVIPPTQKPFYDNNCEHKNCFITYNKSFLENQGYYDAIVFSGCGLKELDNVKKLPQNRSTKQKYIFASLQSSTECPVLSPMYDNFFNWTWSYKLTSDLKWNYMVIKDNYNNFIGPALNVEWPKCEYHIPSELRQKLKRKNKVVALFTSHNNLLHNGTRSFLKTLKQELKKYGWTLDTYRRCDYTIGISSWCLQILERDYHFYLVIENLLDEDFVSEYLLRSMMNAAVPIVYGVANYSRYLPPGSYIDAKILGPTKLPEVLNIIMNNKTLYYDCFKWKNHLKYEYSFTSSNLCNLCGSLNDEKMIKNLTTYKKFRTWWNSALSNKPRDFEKNYNLDGNTPNDKISNYNSTALNEMKHQTTEDTCFKCNSSENNMIGNTVVPKHTDTETHEHVEGSGESDDLSNRDIASHSSSMSVSLNDLNVIAGSNLLAASDNSDEDYLENR